MKTLDQSDIDALLASADSIREDESAADAALGIDESAHPDVSGAIPREYVLKADARRLTRIKPLKVPLLVRLAERNMPLGDLLEMTVGTIIEFDKSSDSDLDLVVNNVVIGKGNAVKCGERFGLRIIRIEPWIARIMSDGLYR